MSEQIIIGCSDECGQHLPAEAIERAGWTFLPIRSRWRCPECWRALERINRPKGRGALSLDDGSIGQ